MTVLVCLAAVGVVGWVVTAAVCWRTLAALDHERREHGRREDLLVNELLHAAGKPWQPSPAAEAWRLEDMRVREERADAYAALVPPEQQPLD